MKFILRFEVERSQSWVFKMRNYYYILPFIFSLISLNPSSLYAEQSFELTDLYSSRKTQTPRTKGAEQEKEVPIDDEKKEKIAENASQPTPKNTASIGSVTIQPLEKVDINSAGTTENFYEFDLKICDWNGSARETIGQILTEIPIMHQSKVLKNLSKILLEGAFKFPTSNHPLEDRALLLIRAEKLLQMGFVAQAIALLNSHKSLHTEPLYLRLKFESDIMTARTEEACQLAQQQVQLSPTPYWEKAMIICQIKDADFSAARLSIAVLSDGSYEKEKDFIQTVHSILEPELHKSIVHLRPTDFLSLIALSLTPGGIHANVLSNISQAYRAQLTTLSNPPNSPAPKKLALLEESVNNGHISANFLFDHYHLYAHAHIAEKTKWDTQTLESLQDMNTSEARTLLYFRAFFGEKNQQYSALCALLTNAQRFGLYNGVSKALIQKLKNIDPKDAHAYMVDIIVPALMMSGQNGSVCKWQHYIDPAHSITAIPLTMIGCHNMNATYRQHLLSSWLKHLRSYNNREANLYAEVILRILEVFNIHATEAQWATIGDTPDYQTTRFSEKKYKSLEYASQNNRRAEVIGRILVDISPPAYWTMDNILFALTILESTDLNKVAIQLATEVILSLKAPKKNAPE